MQFLADTFSLEVIEKLAHQAAISGATSNTAIAAKEGIANYFDAAESLAEIAHQLDVSISPPALDTPEALLKGALILRSIGPFRIKIPITTSAGTPTHDVIMRLRGLQVPINITAVLDAGQLHSSMLEDLQPSETILVSVFAGRCRDIGRNPSEVIRQVRSEHPRSVKTIWASTRDLQSIVEAESACSDYVTARPELLLRRIGPPQSLDETTQDVLREFQAAADKMGY
ncbi:transaldolase family protein [Kribbella solani]|uniref:transaldolase family protein n=1 Tax=Kribbella solani TaxID=236067 RepID=UPI0029B8D803|nr:transaldolase family protein [Kribbella solani]MDX2972176.1 transaldolase family protein [Kribbella solani]